MRPTTFGSYCDMTPEHRTCAVKEAPQRHPLLDDSVNNFLLKGMTAIGRPLLGNVSVNMPGQQQGIFIAGQWMCFLDGPCQRVIKDTKGRLQSVGFWVPAGQDMSLEAGAELRNHNYWVQVSLDFKVSLWREDFMCAVVQWYLECYSYSSCVKICCQETDSENTVKE
jgi:hypothetical protein